MARWDKVDSTTGMHRAHLKDPVPEARFDKITAIGLDANGLALQNAPGQSGFVGLAILHRLVRRAGSRIDIASVGEIVECEGLQAGRKYYIQNDGSLGVARTAIYAGYTVEADRLVVVFSGKADA